MGRGGQNQPQTDSYDRFTTESLEFVEKWIKKLVIWRFSATFLIFSMLNWPSMTSKWPDMSSEEFRSNEPHITHGCSKSLPFRYWVHNVFITPDSIYQKTYSGCISRIWTLFGIHFILTLFYLHHCFYCRDVISAFFSISVLFFNEIIIDAKILNHVFEFQNYLRSF